MYSSVFTLVVMLNLVLAGAQWHSTQNGNFDMPNLPGVDVVNVGNGVNRNNFVVVDERASRQPNPSPTLRNRFNSEPNVGQSRTTINNIGNGYGNENTVVAVNGDRRTLISQSSNSNRMDPGRSFTMQGSNGGIDLYNVGHGPNNRNQVIVNGRPVVPANTDSRGSTYNIQRENTAGEGRRSPVSQPSSIKRQQNQRVSPQLDNALKNQRRISYSDIYGRN